MPGTKKARLRFLWCPVTLLTSNVAEQLFVICFQHENDYVQHAEHMGYATRAMHGADTSARDSDSGGQHFGSRRRYLWFDGSRIDPCNCRRK